MYMTILACLLAISISRPEWQQLSSCRKIVSVVSFRAKNLILYHFPLQCLCKDCDLELISSENMSENEAKSIRINQKTLSPGSTTWCSYKNGQDLPHVTFSKYSDSFILHLMLWPSVIFIIGFLGVFFSTLSVMEDLMGKMYDVRKNGRERTIPLLIRKIHSQRIDALEV